MPTLFVSRHGGAIDWASRKGIDAERVAHLDVGKIAHGDVVLGTLPIHLAADVNARGARYFHLEIDVPAELRGKDLSADDMERLGAKLTEFHVVKVDDAGGRT